MKRLNSSKALPFRSRGRGIERLASAMFVFLDCLPRVWPMGYTRGKQSRNTNMADASLSIPRPRDLKGRAFEEFKRFIVIFLYLWVVFGLLSIHKSLVLSQRHLDQQEHTFAIINAFIFAKVLLVGEQLHLGRRFENKPLIYPILHKCFIFTVVLIS